ncbi:hypothetical protein EDD37DRAFT_563844 [Exophiala viscosa]|uniref:uncharacterized protein n=1 Tax=Exophiala viscosa TaxID=2486360 RepID=UPI00219516ED|nr:hypothetical protein EDD37DRAFT_563844 [Exophiala viscosa]
MGNEQSQESGAPPQPEEAEQTDLSDIPDDREPDEVGDTTITAPPVEVPKLAKEKTQKKKKRKKKRGRISAERDSSEEIPVLSQVVPTPEQIELLRKREPEAFDVYATSDVSDGEGGATETPPGPHDSVSGDADDEEATEESPPAAENEEAIEESPVEADDGEAIEEIPLGADDEEAIADTGLNPNTPAPGPTNASVPEPDCDDEGRFLCPFAKNYDCRETFAKRKTAIRHASIHTQSYACLVCDQKLSRADTLKRHMAKHTAVELALAEARVGHGQDADEDGSLSNTNVPENDMLEDEQEMSRASDADAVSETQSPTPSSVFEEPEEKPADLETARANGLKRKRTSLETAQVATPTLQKPTKRRKRIQNSPPTSAQSEVTRSESPAIATTIKKTALSGQITDKIVPTLRKGRQGTIDGWARSNSVTSQSPAPPAQNSHVEVVVPLSQAGPSGGFTSVNGNTTKKASQTLSKKETRPSGLDAFALKKARRAAYTTPKGKKRADPDVDYSTPATIRRAGNNEVDGSDAEPSQMATSIAKKTFPSSQVRRAGAEDEDADSDFDDADNSSRSKPRQHYPNVHSKLYRCDDCTERFWNTRLLTRHEKDTGHGKEDLSQGRTGPFSGKEVRALQNWRDTFCGDHNITTEQFNDMMTDSLNRINSTAWPWHFITRVQFLKEYVEVLPGRNKRSMLRYRERNFQNLEGSRNWTQEDDKELTRLYKQFGPKWSEIAKRLTRTTDAVSQRWRHKLQHRDVDKGQWTEDEIAKFSNALVQVRREFGPVADSQDWQVPWSKISQKVGTRTPQQCSNHYRAVHGMKQGGRWVKVEGLEKTPGSSRILTPSKMERRLRGDKIESSLRNPISPEIIQSEDEDDDQDEDTAAENENKQDTDEEQDGQDEDDQENVEDPDEEDEGSPESASRLPRNPLNHKTPKGALQLSQLFNRTQANTSALGRSPETIRQAPSQDVPSPSIPIQRRALSQRSPLQEIKVKENGELVMEDDEDQDGDEDENEEATGGPEGADANARGAVTDQDDYIPLDQGAVESDAGSDENEDDDREEGNDDAASNNFLNSIEESAQRVRSSQLQPRFVQSSARSSRRKGWSLSPSESSDESEDEQ